MVTTTTDSTQAAQIKHENLHPAYRRMVAILGIPIDAINMNEALQRIDDFIQFGRVTGKSHQVATVNTDFIVNAIQDPELRFILQECDLATVDGMPVVLGSRLLGVPLHDRVTGSDMIPLLVERAAQKGHSVYFFGAGPGVAARAAEILKQRNPELIVAGVCSPPFTSILEMDPAYIEAIRDAHPDILLVAFGNPKQEKWIAMHRYDLKIPVMIGIGGTLDFIAGSYVRAPRWMQRMGLEWLDRLRRDPRRLWRRYFVDFYVFGTFLVRQLWEMKRFGNLPITLPISDEILLNGVGILRVSGTLSIANLASFSKKVADITAQASHLVIDFSDADFIDSAAVGTLVRLAKQLRDAGGELYLVSLPEKIRKTIELLRLDTYFVIKNRSEDILYKGKDIRSVPEELEQHNREETIRLDGITWTVFQAPARFDASTANEVLQQCSPILENSSNLLLDFSNTAMLASAGLAVLAKLYQVAQRKGCKLMITGVNTEVLTVIKFVKFDQFLQIHSPARS